MAGNDAFTKLMLHCDGADASTTFTDVSASAHTVTANGNAQVDTAQSVFGGASALFDGNGDYLSIPSHADWSFDGDFTIDGRVRLNSIPAVGTYQNTIIQTNYAGGGASSGVYFGVSVGGIWYCEFNGGNSITGSGTASTATWYHFAIVRSGSTITLYIDGVSRGTVSYAATIANGNPLRIGHGWNTDIAARYLDGWVDELRISKGVARWTAAFTPPDRAYTLISMPVFKRPTRFFTRKI